MSEKFITLGTPTSTGGKVITASSSMVINGQKVVLIGDTATCNCGKKSCNGQGVIACDTPRKASIDGILFARKGDRVLSTCGTCFLLDSPHEVYLGTNTACGLQIGGNGAGIVWGNGVKINADPNLSSSSVSSFSSVASTMNPSASHTSASSSMSNATAAPSANVPKVNPDNMYWPPYNFLAEEGQKEIKVEYITPITSFAVLSPEEAYEFLQNLYLDMGEKEIVSNMRSYFDLVKGGTEAYFTAQGLGGLGVTSYTKNINGQDWVIIKNFRRHAQTLMKGNKWLANNPQAIQAGLGLNDLKGATRYVKFNAGVEIAFSIGINVVDYILSDDATLTELGVNSATDIVKGMISLAGAAAATVLITATIPFTATVLGAGITFAVTSFLIGGELDSLDDNIGFSANITQAVEEYFK